jgi:hypothetical protein
VIETVSFKDSLKDALQAIKENPKLFLPKIVLSLIWGLFLLYLSSLLVEMLSLNLTDSEQVASIAPLILGKLLWFFVFFIAFYLVDVFVNAAYPFLLEQFFEKKPLSLKQAFNYVSRNLLRILSPIIASIVLILAVSFPFALFLSFSLVLKDSVLIVIAGILAIAVVFVLSAVFYFVYPISVLEKTGLSSLTGSFNELKRNPRPVSFAVLITYALTIATVFLAIGIEAIQFAGLLGLITFFVLRIITALLATYQMVLNPVVYLEYVKKISFK